MYLFLYYHPLTSVKLKTYNFLNTKNDNLPVSLTLLSSVVLVEKSIVFYHQFFVLLVGIMFDPAHALLNEDHF